MSPSGPSRSSSRCDRGSFGPHLGTGRDFDIAPQPGDVVLEGNASNNPIWDVVARALGAIPDQTRPKSAARESR